MAKYIKDVCDDRFDAGVDAWRHLLIRARVSPHEEVREAAELADEKLTVAISYLDAVETVSKRIERDEREAERNAADERQQELDMVERCRDCAHHGIPEESGEAVAAGEGYCKETDMLVVSDTPAVEQECGHFKARDSIVVREYECDDCINGRYEEDPTKLHCVVVGGTVDANTAANLPCGSSFEEKGCATCRYGDGEMPSDYCFSGLRCAPPEVTAWEPAAE